MSKIKQFLKKYGIWLLIGAVIGSIIVLIILLTRKKEEDILLDIPVEKITSPYIETGERVSISMDIQEETFEEREWVYRVKRPDAVLFTNFVENFYEINEDVNMEEEIIITSGEDMFWYHSDIGVLSVFSEGLVLDLKITYAADVSSFFSQYFGIREAINTKVENTDKGVLYAGHFQYNDVKIGSTHIGGYSYKLEIDTTGKLVEISMLLLEEADIEKYQAMPTTPLSDLLQIRSYPKKIVNKTIEQRFYEQSSITRGSASLDSIVVKEKDLLYLLNDFQDQFVLPTYKISGDGELVDSKGERYWTTSDIFICAIDPEYLYEKAEEDYREKPHSDPS
jgi:hypothetical protein